MPLFRRTPKLHHHVVVHDMRSSAEEEPFFAWFCECGTAGMPCATSEEAFAGAYGHHSNVSEEVVADVGEGGSGWRCLFCGIVIDEHPIRLAASWTDAGEEHEQWWAAHRECLVRHMAEDESIRSGPLFGD